MKNKVGLFALLVALCFLGRPSLAAVCESDTHPGITALFVDSATKQGESLGGQWVYHYRELIRKSAAFCLVDKEEKALLTVSIIGANADPNGVSTAMSVVSFFANGCQSFFDHAVYVTGSDHVEHSAQVALADLDADLERHNKSAR
jgi:hypothetical protein